ncbi:hypothetical protein BaRGS_00024627 [Batillaria attramentaria]|uniref:Uncharacterized protein n=1 Tax=Batillaria attramentaria TaxID=370345 RepID=A0ABD0KAM2_9CAEN
MCLATLFPLAVAAMGEKSLLNNGGDSSDPRTFVPNNELPPAVRPETGDTGEPSALASGLNESDAIRTVAFSPDEEFNSDFGNMTSCGDGMCRCNATYADCSKHGANLTYVPQLPPGVTFLNFTYNRAHINHDDFFRNVTGIDHLEIGDNEIRWISPGAFKTLPKLKILDLGRNNLTYTTLAPVLSVKTLTKLNVIEMSLGNVPDDLFHDYPLLQLEILLMYGNKMRKLNLSVFAPLRNLRKLVLGSNKISEIETTYLPNLRYLSLDDCGIPFFPETCGENSSASLFPRLETLYLK